jgi:hypothetical protein
VRDIERPERPTEIARANGFKPEVIDLMKRKKGKAEVIQLNTTLIKGG